MSKYGVGIDQFAHILAKDSTLGKDISLDIAVHLAKAWLAMQELKKSGADITFQDRELVFPYLERAWRDLIKIRSGLPADSLDVKDLSRYGRIFHAVEIPDSSEQDPGGHS